MISFFALQMRAALFGAALVGLIIVSRLLWPAHALIHRMDALFLAALAIQLWLIATHRETPEEARAILVFHLAGTAMELYKTWQGSWLYPDVGFFHIGPVPLFAGFMYAAVGSWMMRVWRLMDMRLERAPPSWAIYALGVAAYVNFFTHHYVYDLRLALFAGAILLFWRTRLSADWGAGRRSAPFLAPFTLGALLIWLAENFATWGGVWLYPHQLIEWRMVPLAKMGSWFLLLLLSFALTAGLRRRAP